MITAHKKRMFLIALVSTSVILFIVTAIDQVELEMARLGVQKTLYSELPPGTVLYSAMEYLERNRYFPDYIGRDNIIDAARGYDVPAFPAPVGRRILIIGYLDSQQKVARWEVTADRIFIPLP